MASNNGGHASSGMPSDFPAKIEQLSAWHKANPKLPEEIEPILLRRFLKSRNGDVKEAQRAIELNYALRNKHAALFMERDPAADKFRAARDIYWTAALPGLTPDGSKVFFHRMAPVAAAVADNGLELQAVHMLFDTSFTLPDDELNTNEYDNLAAGHVQIVDMRNITFRYIVQQSSWNFANNKMLHEAHPAQVKAIHLLNPPSYMHWVRRFFGLIVPRDVMRVVHVHSAGVESLYEFVPQDMLPTEYGGKAGALETLRDKWTQLMLDKREYLTNPKYWRPKQPAPPSRWRWW